jgi:hypothetical protein
MFGDVLAAVDLLVNNDPTIHIPGAGQHEAAQYDWGDAPDKPYPTFAVNEGAHHVIDPEVFLGHSVEPEVDGQPTVASDGDDVNAGVMVDDEDGVQFLTPLIPNMPANVEVVASTDGWLNAWADFDRDGTWSGAAENIFSAQPLAAGINVLSFMVPPGTVPSPNRPIYTRWRFSTTDKVLRPEQPAGVAIPDGEVEDHLGFVHEGDPQQRMDFGDAPDQPYPTLLVNDGARHLINPEVFMGFKIDAEADGQPTFPADGDDNAVSDDEDGVRFLTPLVPGQVAKVEVIVSIDGFLDAWIDYDQDGVWTPAEQIAASKLMVVGPNTFDFVVPAGAIPHPTRPTYARFRFSMNGGLQPEGLAPDGEVEDYAVLNGDLNSDGSATTHDIDDLCAAIHAGSSAGDLNGDGVVDENDMDYLVHQILGTTYGDANMDGIFNSADLVQIFASGEYEDAIDDNSQWAEGDFDCNGDFDSSDIVQAMQGGGYSSAALPKELAAVDALFRRKAR